MHRPGQETQRCTSQRLLRALYGRRALQTRLVTRAPGVSQRWPLPPAPWPQPLRSLGPPAGAVRERRRDGAPAARTAQRRGWTERLWLRADPGAPWLCARSAGVRPARGTAALVI